MFDVSFTPEPWMEDSKCANDRELAQWQRENRDDQFFDERSDIVGVSVSAYRKKRAARYCASCPVRSDCLAYALRNDEQGIWAGTTGRDRRAMKKKADKAVREFLRLRQVQLPGDADPNASSNLDQRSA